MPRTPLTKPSTAPSEPSLAEVARRLIRPAGIVSTGFPAVRDTCSRLGLGFDRWQADGAKLILAKDASGLYATDTVVISIPRQVGKTYLIGAIIFALCLIHPGITVIWTAHRFKTARETFASMKGLAKKPKLAAHISRTPSAAGSEAIEFHNGSRILFGARERGFGRGFAGVAIVVFDEAQILTENAVDDIVPATNTIENALVIYTGTPPKPSDPSEVFTAHRREAIAAGDGDAEILYIELGADPDADVNDREQLRKANPSYPRRTSERSIRRMQKNLGADSFRREGLGIWDGDGPNALPSWAARSSPGLSPSTSGFVIGVAAAPDGSRASIAAASRVGDLIEVGVVDRRKGKGWLVDELARLRAVYGAAVFVRAKGALSEMAQDFDDAGVAATEVDEASYVDACGTFARLVEEAGLVHPGHPALNRGVAAATWRKVGERRVLIPAGDADISMVEAAVLAVAQADNDYNVLDSAY